MSDPELFELIAIGLDFLIVIFLFLNLLYFYGVKKVTEGKLSLVMFLLLHPYQLFEAREKHKNDGCPICKEDEEKWKTRSQ